jgi:hypothetical protein
MRHFNMELNLDKYSTESIFKTYEFLLLQYLAGQLSAEQHGEHDFSSTVYVFGETCKELRCQYLSRKDANENELVALESKATQKVAQMMSVPKQKLVDLAEMKFGKLFARIRSF